MAHKFGNLLRASRFGFRVLDGEILLRLIWVNKDEVQVEVCPMATFHLTPPGRSSGKKGEHKKHIAWWEGGADAKKIIKTTIQQFLKSRPEYQPSEYFCSTMSITEDAESS